MDAWIFEGYVDCSISLQLRHIDVAATSNGIELSCVIRDNIVWCKLERYMLLCKPIKSHS